MESQKQFTLDELAKFDDKNGNPACVAYKGKVFDVTESSFWVDGEHLGHFAGKDLTEGMEISPHGDSVVEKMKLVGTLV